MEFQQKLFFKSSNGTKLSGILSDPKKDFSKPLIVICHGFGSSKNTANAVRLEKDLNALGLGTFRFDFFGHGESEGELEKITSSEGVDNILQAINTLEKLGYQKLGLSGSSFGALCSLIASTQSSNIKFLSLIAPLFNYQEKETEKLGIEKVREWKEKGVRDYIKHNGRIIQLKYDLFKDAEKNNGYEFAKKVKIPTLIVHGAKDITVPLKQSLKVKELISNSKLEILPEADHYFSRKEDFEQMIQWVKEFVQKQANL